MGRPFRSGHGFGADASGSVWEVGLVAMPALVAEADGSTMRPLIALVLEAGGAIRSSAVGHPERPLEALQPAIANALDDPQAPCRPGPPRRVVVNRPELLELLPALLPGVMVTRGATPQVDRAARLMREQLSASGDQRGTEALSTYLTGDIGPEAVARFFEAVAALYERRPWQRIPSDGHLFQVSCSALAIRGWVGCVIGQHRENYGVILFDSLSDYERYVELAERFERGDRQAMEAAPRHRAINFEARADMPPALLKEIRRYGWPVARGDAYPTVMLIEPDAVLKPPRRAELQQLEAVALALQAWIDAEPQIERLWQLPSAKRRRFQVTVADQRLPVTIGVVAHGSGRQAPAEPEPGRRTPAPHGDASAERYTTRPAASLKVPAALRQRVDSLMARIDPFCDRHLNGDYRELIHAAVAALARKRPSPLLTGRESSWAAGVVHAIGAANFLFDRSQNPHCSAATIAEHFGIATSTSNNHANKVRDLLDIRPFSIRWSLPELLESSSLPWMLEVDGFLHDVRTLPLELQMQACAMGLIPYVPALRDQARGRSTGQV
ncbi:MAG: DUF6398 domain-containing protein [Synechococcaceae cyanobacterium]|nr:DUF6398 domain-containing protein [Synechococcaceae cyanobacterium]